jgi:hypothetical protein
MIYSKFGTTLTLITKTQNAAGKVSVQATSPGSTDVLEYNATDLKADDGLPEITAALAKLPLKIFENTTGRRRKPS